MFVFNDFTEYIQLSEQVNKDCSKAALLEKTKYTDMKNHQVSSIHLKLLLK